MHTNTHTGSQLVLDDALSFGTVLSSCVTKKKRNDRLNETLFTTLSTSKCIRVQNVQQAAVSRGTFSPLTFSLV